MTVRTTGERIAERFVTAIALGQFVPGQRLPTERELAAMLSVSRATVREAIARLAEAGYVTVRRGRSGGTFVTSGWGPESAEMIRRTLSNEWQEVESLLDFRQVIEQQIARTAALRRTDTDVKAIRGALADYERAGEDRDSSRMADLALHRAIADATHNPHLTNLSLSIRHDISFGFEAEPYSPEVRGRALHQHPALAAAVIDGYPDRAASLAAEHFSLTESMLRELHARVMLRAGTTTGATGVAHALCRRERDRRALPARRGRARDHRAGQRPRRRPRDLGLPGSRPDRRRVPAADVRQPRHRPDQQAGRAVLVPAAGRRRQGPGGPPRHHAASTCSGCPWAA